MVELVSTHSLGDRLDILLKAPRFAELASIARDIQVLLEGWYEFVKVRGEAYIGEDGLPTVRLRLTMRKGLSNDAKRVAQRHAVELVERLIDECEASTFYPLSSHARSRDAGPASPLLGHPVRHGHNVHGLVRHAGGEREDLQRQVHDALRRNLGQVGTVAGSGRPDIQGKAPSKGEGGAEGDHPDSTRG